MPDVSPTANSGVTIFAALEPDPALASLVADYKRQTRALAGEQLYLGDPPHLTVYLAVFPSVAEALAVWPKVKARHDDLRLKITGWHVFEADALTGNNTLVCEIAGDDVVRLREYQREVVSLLAPLRDPTATAQRFAPRRAQLTDEQRTNIDQHGFPYLFDGWVPHLTIASIPPAPWPAVWNALKSQIPRGAYRCSGWRLYQLVDGRPCAIDGGD
jgi:hypothetical protein